eukprot:TRINITY_DN17211_c0_g1_i4.p1 TRINITY_DN17211_c0_g1~~TRINITY_DN17211_c0_g1_i4.p1  ORF type:complete len:535 (+),score=175.84 TRINITY_DN17211_c0_g1_i4:1172-2776(+)
MLPALQVRAEAAPVSGAVDGGVGSSAARRSLLEVMLHAPHRRCVPADLVGQVVGWVGTGFNPGTSAQVTVTNEEVVVADQPPPPPAADSVNARLLLLDTGRSGLSVLCRRSGGSAAFQGYGGLVRQGPTPAVVAGLLRLVKSQSGMDLPAAAGWKEFVAAEYDGGPSTVWYTPTCPVAAAAGAAAGWRPEWTSLASLLASDEATDRDAADICMAADSVEEWSSRAAAGVLRRHLDVRRVQAASSKRAAAADVASKQFKQWTAGTERRAAELQARRMREDLAETERRRVRDDVFHTRQMAVVARMELLRESARKVAQQRRRKYAQWFRVQTEGMTVDEIAEFEKTNPAPDPAAAAGPAADASLHREMRAAKQADAERDSALAAAREEEDAVIREDRKMEGYAQARLIRSLSGPTAVPPEMRAAVLHFGSRIGPALLENVLLYGGMGSAEAKEAMKRSVPEMLTEDADGMLLLPPPPPPVPADGQTRHAVAGAALRWLRRIDRAGCRPFLAMLTRDGDTDRDAEVDQPSAKRRRAD